MRSTLLAFVLLACSASSTGARIRAPTTDIASLAWMHGRWCGVHDDGTFCETWRNSTDGSMTGDGAFERNGQRVFSEALRIEQRTDGVYYVASPEGQTVTAFRLTRVSSDEAVFENPQHDFPMRITYQRRAPDGLVAVVEGGERRSEFSLTRAEPHTEATTSTAAAR
jgi:hypothetical protein